MGASVSEEFIIEQEMQDLDGLLNDLLRRISSSSPMQARHVASMLRVTAEAFDLVPQDWPGNLVPEDGGKG